MIKNIMKIGCCLPGGSFMPQGECDINPTAKKLFTDADAAAIKAGYDFTEATVGLALNLSDEETKELALLKKAGRFHLEVCNSFIPPQLKICNGKMRAEIKDYVERAMERFCILDVSIVVLGSGQARMIPVGMDKASALEELDFFLNMCNELGKKYNVRVALEPLNKKECNVFNTAAECALELRKLNKPGIKLLIDAYHMYCENESFDVIAENIDILIHTHIAEVPERVYPGKSGGEYLKKFAAELKKAGYSGRVTAECGFSDFYAEIIPAARFMRNNF